MLIIVENLILFPRFQQKAFRINESFLLSLGELKHLQQVCIIAKGGPLTVAPKTVISLFEKVNQNNEILV